MTLNLLDHFLIGQLGAFFLIFCRIGAAVMVMPAIGDSYVNVRTRLLFALGLSMMLTPLLSDMMPKLPANTISLTLLIACEALVGMFVGMIARTILSILHVAGTTIAFQSSLAVSSIFDPVTGTQTAVMSNFMTIVAVTVMLALNLHHLMFASILESYHLFKPGEYPMVEDMFKYHARLTSDCFAMGIMIAAPHIVFSFVYYLMGGLMTRLMPNFQIFYVMMTPQILIAFFLLFACLTIMIEVFTSFMQDRLLTFMGAF